MVNEEMSQTRSRGVIALGVFLFLACLAIYEGLPVLTAYHSAAVVIGAYGLVAFLWLALIRTFPDQFPARKILTVIGDLSMTTWGIYLVGDIGVIFYPLFLWIIVGNGIRFGQSYFILALVAGQLGFTSLYFFSEYWRTNLTLGISMQIALCILPVFYMSIVKRIHELNERLAQEAERSRSAAESKAQFLANMSHELRTPMNGVLGITELLQDTELQPKQREMLALVHRSADNLLGIINDILDYSKVDAGMLLLDNEPFDLKNCVEDVVSLLEHSAKDAGLVLECEFPASIPGLFTGDRSRLRQILMNLIGNAIKFTEAGGVFVTCSVDQQISESSMGENDSISNDIPCEGNIDSSELYSLEIAVKDTGIGIPAESLDRIFDQFEQADASTERRFGGTGLGLAISRKLATLMGGELNVESVFGEGTTFTVKLMLPVSHETITDAVDVMDTRRNYKLSALVAEDNHVNQMVVKGLLGKVGIDVDIAENGQVAIDKYKASEYQLVFMDLQMPVVSGELAARTIREMSAPKSSVPIIALSANTELEATLNREANNVSDNALQDDFDGFVSKPFSLQRIVKVIDEIESRVH